MELFECSDGSLINPDLIEECCVSCIGEDHLANFMFTSGRAKPVKHKSESAAKAEMREYRDHVTNFYADPFIDMLSLDGPAGSRH